MIPFIIEEMYQKKRKLRFLGCMEGTSWKNKYIISLPPAFGVATPGHSRISFGFSCLNIVRFPTKIYPQICRILPAERCVFSSEKKPYANFLGVFEIGAGLFPADKFMAAWGEAMCLETWLCLKSRQLGP